MSYQHKQHQHVPIFYILNIHFQSNFYHISKRKEENIIIINIKYYELNEIKYYIVYILYIFMCVSVIPLLNYQMHMHQLYLMLHKPINKLYKKNLS